MDRPGIVEGHISSDFSALDNLNQQLASLAGSLGWDDSLRDSLSIACIEALSNAIEHGNGFDPSRKIHYLIEADPRHFVFRIRDEGEGFDPADYLRELPEPESGKIPERGRGLSIIHSLVDRVFGLHDDEGRFTLVLEKDLSGEVGRE
jgi:anti-sigma regulatory factor (Ser/Thr protein kinase)